MATAIQWRRGTTAQHSSFTGLVGEITVDTDLDTLRVHDGSTAGGHRLAKYSEIGDITAVTAGDGLSGCLLYTSPSPRDQRGSRMPSSA